MRPSTSTAPLAILCLAGACNTPPPEPAIPNNISELVGTWTWVGEPAPGGRIPTLTITREGRLHGNAGINKYQGRLTRRSIGAGDWDMETLTATEMAGTHLAQTKEKSILNALAGAETVRIAGDVMHLSTRGVKLASFRRARIR